MLSRPELMTLSNLAIPVQTDLIYIGSRFAIQQQGVNRKTEPHVALTVFRNGGDNTGYQQVLPLQRGRQTITGLP